MRGWADGFAAVDWGSTARRLYLLDEAGRIFREAEDDAGTLTIPQDRFSTEVDTLREQAGGRPLLLAGMVGSNRGWMEAPYAPCAATLPDIVSRLLWAEPERIAIVPGVSFTGEQRADVMRGEEVQVFGAQVLRPNSGRALICHPGTHTKWIEVDGGAIVRFRTIMTGELFALLRAHSILADLLATPATLGPAFQRGVERGFAEGALGAELFSIRAGVLLGTGERSDASSFASGLLIGCDLRTGLATAAQNDEVVVLGRGLLTSLYAAAISQVGYSAREMDGAEAFVAGMHAIAQEIT